MPTQSKVHAQPSSLAGRKQEPLFAQGWRSLARRRSLLAPLLLLSAAFAIVCVVHAPSLQVYFHADDFVALVDVVTKDQLPHFIDSLTYQDANFYWRPLGDAYYYVIFQMAGLNAFWFRMGNLVVFLVSLLLVYMVTRKLGFASGTAVVAVLLFGLFPNHVVSVAWITNGPRLVANLLFLIALLLTHQAILRADWRLDAVAWMSFLFACLFDEVTVALAPILVLTSSLIFCGRESYKRQSARLLAYAVIAVVLIPPQFIITLAHDSIHTLYHVSPHIPEQLWALVSQLVAPLAPSNPMDVAFGEMPALQWAAGAIAAILGLLLLIFGSMRARFLVLWTVAGLAPFALWDTDVVAPRYVYYSAVPFAILVAHLGFVLLRRSRGYWSFLLGPALAALLFTVLAWGAVTTMERNQDFEESTKRYEILATQLPVAVPNMPRGSTVFLFNGIWDGFTIWNAAVVRTVYKDRSLNVVNVPAGQVSPTELRPGDIVVYFQDGVFTTSP